MLSLAILRCEAVLVAATLPETMNGTEREGGNRHKKVKMRSRITEENEGRDSVHVHKYKMVPQ